MLIGKRKNKVFKISPSHKNNLDMMKLLVTSLQFQEIIKDARKFLEIQENGWGNDQESVKKWTEKMDNRFDKEFLSKKLDTQLNKIRQNIEEEKISKKMAKEHSKLLHKKLTWNFLYYTIDFIIEKFKLPLNFRDNLRDYIIFGTISAPSANFSVHIEPIPEGIKISNLPYLPIRIYSQLTNSDLKEIKEMTEFFSKKLPKYNQIKNMDEKIKLDDWNKHKEKFNEAEQKTYKMTAKEISKNILNNPEKTQKVYDSSRSLERLRRKRFGTDR
jgi:hypothetical protein